VSQRLAAEPIGAEGFLASAIACFGMAGAIYYGATSNHTGPIPFEIWAALGFVSLFGLALVVAMLRKASRPWGGRGPVVEVDVQPWRPGQRQQLRVVVPDLASLIELEVSLQAVSWERVTGRRKTKHQVPVHTTTLLTVSGDELAQARTEGRLDRTVEVVVPSEGAGQRWLWGIHVRATAKALTAFQERTIDKMLAFQMPSHLQGANKELVFREVRSRVRAPAAWEEWFRLEIEGPGA
jgi:hypothetical protein